MNIVFDFAGVVFHWDPRAMLARELPGLAIDAARVEALFDGLFQGWGGDWGEFDRGTIEPGPLAERIAARMALPLADVQRVMRAIPHELAPHAPTLALIERLHRAGHRLFYLSNMPAPYAEVLLAAHGFLRRFDDGVISAHVRAIKPEPEIFALAARRFGVAPAELIFIDDMPANVAAAQACGWRALPFHSAQQVAAELAALGVAGAVEA